MMRLVETLSQILSAAAVLGLVGAVAAPPASAQVPVRTVTPEMRAALETCRADIERICPGVEPGEGRILACMREHRADITPACRAAVRAAAPEAAAANGGGN
jgi:hypothetical protein